MEISVASITKAVSSTFYTPFSDQSHLQFYGHGSRSFPTNSKFHLRTSRTSVTPAPLKAPSRALCSGACKSVEQTLMKELADLKLQMKQKKKQLKVQVKDDVKKRTQQKKREKKRKRLEGKSKLSSPSESSSGSDSCNEVCSSVSMKALRKGHSVSEDGMVDSGGGSVLGNLVASSAGIASSSRAASGNDTLDVRERFDPSFLSLRSDVVEKISSVDSVSEDSTEKCSSRSFMGNFNGCETIPALKFMPDRIASENGSLSPSRSAIGSRAVVALHVLPSLGVSNRIEVCVGGKCKKSGSEELLLALKGQIPGSSGMQVVPCKCMGKCSTPINVRVFKDDTNPLHHSHVDVEDASLIVRNQYGIGRPSLGLPMKDGMRAPLSAVVVEPL